MRARPIRLAACAAVLPLLAAGGCVSHRGHIVPPGAIDARHHALPDGARAGMSVAWRYSKEGADPEDVVLEERACVGETPDTITMETRTTDVAGRRLVVTTRHARDGNIVAAWRGAPGAAGTPAGVVATDPPDWEQVGSRVEEMRLASGLPKPKVSTGHDREVVETPAGRIPCTRETIKVSILGMGSTVTIWRAESPLPLTNGGVVRLLMEGLGGRRETMLVAYSSTGAKPTLSVPP